MNNATILSQKIIYKADLFKITQTELKLTSGEKHVYQEIHVCPCVFIFPLTDKNEIYLIYEYRYLLKKKVLSAAAGFCKAGETSIQAAKRELKEETGLVAFQWEELSRINTENSVVESQKHLFLARDLEIAERNPEVDEEIKIIKMPLREAINKVFTGEISGTGSIIGILLLDRLNRERKI